MPMVSVVMPCYNHGKYVGEAIRSVLNQTYTDFEFFMVDNGCTDNSYEVMKSFNDDRIHIIRFEKNDPDGAARYMFDQCQGKYVAQMFADDYWEPDKLRRQVEAMENHPECEVCATWAVLCDEDLVPIEDTRSIYMQHNRSRHEWIRYLLDMGNCLCAPSTFATKSMLEAMMNSTGGFWQQPDTYMWLDALMNTELYMVEECLVKQRVHSHNTHISFPSQENIIRTRMEQGKLLLNVIEDMSDEDFKIVFADKMINKNANSHIQIIWEKFFVILDYAGRDESCEDCALYYFYRYYSYTEGGVHSEDVLKAEYGYSREKFSEISGGLGQVAAGARYRTIVANLTGVIRNFVDDDDVKKLRNVSEILGRSTEESGGQHEASWYEGLADCMSELDSMWEWLDKMEIGLNHDEVKMYIRLCRLCCQSLSAEHDDKIEQMAAGYLSAVNNVLNVLDWRYDGER